MKKLLSLLFIFSFLGLAEAQNDCIPKKPRPERLVNDFANILSSQDEYRLERLLVNFNDTTSTQIAVVTVNSLCGGDASSIAYQIGENWGVGSKEFNNGIVLLVKPKIENEKGHVFIATGYGLEGVLPDATAKRIVEKELIPHFKKNDYAGGIRAATKVIIEITGGEYSAKKYNDAKKLPIAAVGFLLLFILLVFFNTLRRARKYGKNNNTGLWTSLWLMGSINNRHDGKYGDFSSGSGGFGSGGFGGGSFGGGGAGGSW